VSDERHELELERTEEVEGKIAGVLVKSDPDEADLRIYPFADSQQVESWWDADRDAEERAGGVDWVFAELSPLQRILDERGITNTAKPPVDRWGNRVQHTHNVRPVVTKSAGEHLDYHVARRMTGDRYIGTELREWAAAWVQAYRDAWDEAEAEFHKYLRRGVPNIEMMAAYHAASQVILPLLRDQLDEVPEARFQVKVTDDGEDVEIDRYINAEPELWLRPERMKARKRAITLGVNLVAGQDRDRQWFANMMVGVTVIANHLVKKGYEVQLLGVRLPLFPVKLDELDDDGKPIRVRGIRGFTFPLVKFGQRFDPIRLLVWGHPAVVRYLGFRWTDEIHGNADGDDVAKKIAGNHGAGRECKLTQDTVNKVGIDWLVTARSDKAGEMAHELITQAGPVLAGLWKASE
jgi:hypothetical protein